MPFLGLDIAAGARVANSEKYGDWYRDPWGWPECLPDLAESLTPEDLGIAKQGKSYNFVAVPDYHVFDVPKSFLGIRPAVVQDARSRLAYVTAAVSLAPALHADLPDWVYGWRVRGGEYAKPSEEWRLYKASQDSIAEAEYAAQTDVTSFFASVDIGRLVRVLRERIGDNTALSIIERILESHDQLASRRGLPQRSSASSMLAQVAMNEIDDLIATALRSGEILKARRWMDDISFEGPEAALYGLLLRLQEHGRHAGLEINTAKTMLVTGEESARRLALEAKHLITIPFQSGNLRDDYDDLFSTYVDASELLDSETAVLDNPTTAARSFAGLVLKSNVYHGNFERAAEWMNAAHHLPHAADHLSRFMASAREDNPWTHLGYERWFVESERSSWPHLEWVSAQHALPIPSEDIAGDALDVLREWLTTSSNLQKVAGAVQRLAKLQPATVRSDIAGRIDKTNDALLVRLLALGHLAAGGPNGFAKRALARHESNQLLVRYLEKHDWTLPRVAADFDPIREDDGDSSDE